MELVSPRRRVLAAALAGLGLRIGTLDMQAGDKAKRRKRKKNQDRCQSGPCTYDACLLYVETIFSRLPDTVVTRPNHKAAAGCCGDYALTKEGKAYRSAVVACIDQYV